MSAAARVGQALAGWKGYAALALAATTLAGGAAWTARGWKADAAKAKITAAHAQERDAQAQATIAAIAAADAAGARSERDGLRVRANALARAATVRDPVLADGSPAGAAAVDLLAYMLSRAVDRATELADVADRARVSGLTCQRAYDALREDD